MLSRSLSGRSLAPVVSLRHDSSSNDQGADGARAELWRRTSRTIVERLAAVIAGPLGTSPISSSLGRTAVLLALAVAWVPRIIHAQSTRPDDGRTRGAAGAAASAGGAPAAAPPAGGAVSGRASRAGERLTNDDTESESGEDTETQQKAVAARFLTLLEKTPRRGTALDRVYGHHVEFGTLDDFLQQLRGRVAQAPQDGVGWMLLGLLEAHRGSDQAAAEAFAKAESLRPQDALAPYYLGQSLLVLGDPDGAAEALERALARKPQRADAMEIYQQLGRLHQRAQRADLALQVWKRLEAQFPNDLRVEEQIATTLAEEGVWAEALTRYEKLAKEVRDDYRRTMFRIKVADLKVRLSRQEAGLADLEQLLSDLNPDSWLYRDVRQQIEEVFLRTGDQDSLVKYYQRWLGAHPEDVDAMARLASLLTAVGRLPEASEWMEKALKLAPKRVELRQAFIAQLIDEQRVSEALEQYALLAEAAPQDSDTLREWGKLVLRDKDRPESERVVEATKIWNRMLTHRPEDAAATAQVADLFRQANVSERALALYEQAVKLAPDEPQYREYLGEYLHVLQRPEDARRTWEAIADGPRRTSVNVARLAEILHSFGYLEAAVEQIAEACQLDRKDFSLQLKAAAFHGELQRYDDALQYLGLADQLATTDDERETVLRQRIELLQLSSRLAGEIERLVAAVPTTEDGTGEQWHQLARFQVAAGRWKEAELSVEEALKRAPESILFLETASGIAAQSGNLQQALEINRRLAAADRRSRAEHWKRVAGLETQLGRFQDALQAGREVVLANPGNTGSYEFFSQLCFQLGQPEEGLNALRKAVRINPTDSELIITLGTALAQQLRSNEAIEVYWRAFEKAESIDDQTQLIQLLAPLYLASNQFDKLIQRLERDQSEDEQRRVMTICLAQAYQTAGDYGNARRELESLLTEETKDAVLLRQLSQLCEQTGDTEAAVNYQRQVVAADPSEENEYQLATLLQDRGDRELASEILVRLTAREEDPARLHRSLDSLVDQEDYESVLRVTGPLLSRNPDDWELLYREIVAWKALDKPQEALDRCHRLLKIKLPHETISAIRAETVRQRANRVASASGGGARTSRFAYMTPSLLSFVAEVDAVRSAVGLDADRNVGWLRRRRRAGVIQPEVWMPDTFAVARMAAYGWLLRLQNDPRVAHGEPVTSERPPAWLAELMTAAAIPSAPRDVMYDWLYVELIRRNFDTEFEIAKRLAAQGGSDEMAYFVSVVAPRYDDGGNEFWPADDHAVVDSRPPLDEDELELLLTCYRTLEEQRRAKAAEAATVMGPASNRVAVSYGGRNYVAQYAYYWTPASRQLDTVLPAFQAAGRHDLVQQLLAENAANAKTSAEIQFAAQLMWRFGDANQVSALLSRWFDAVRREIDEQRAMASKVAMPSSPPANVFNWETHLSRHWEFFAAWLGKLGAEQELDQVLDLLDQLLDVQMAALDLSRQTTRSVSLSNAANNPYYYGRFQGYFGKDPVDLTVDFPTPNRYVDMVTISLLRNVYLLMEREELIEDLGKRLRDRVASAKPEHRVAEQLLLGYFLWWSDEKEDSLVEINAAAALVPEDVEFQLGMAELHEALGNLDDALTLLDSIQVRDQQLVEQREMKALLLAQQLGDEARARQAAERLFGMRISHEMQMTLVPHMRRLGLTAMADAVVARAERKAGNQVSSLSSLMVLYQGQGKTDLAQQLAHTVLRRTQVTQTQSRAMAWRSQMVYGESESRVQALRVLQQTGGLQAVSERLEAQLAASSHAPLRLYQELLEIYDTSREEEKFRSTLEKAVVAYPREAGLRFRLAELLGKSQEASAACDHYLELLRIDPQLFRNDLDEAWPVFAEAERFKDLAQAIATVDPSSFAHSAYFNQLLDAVFADPESHEIGYTLLEGMFDENTANTTAAISATVRLGLVNDSRVLPWVLRGLIPDVKVVRRNPWYGLHELADSRPADKAITPLHALFENQQDAERVAKLRAALEKGVAEMPEWLGGQGILTILDLRNDNEAAGVARIQKICADPKVIADMPVVTSWVLAQELDERPDLQTLVAQLLERAASSVEFGNLEENFALKRLVQLYASLGRQPEARDLIFKQLASVKRPSDGQYSLGFGDDSGMDAQFWAANELKSMGFAVDAVAIYGRMINDAEGLELYGSGGFPDPRQPFMQIRDSLNDAMSTLDAEKSREAIAQLLTVPPQKKADQVLLNLSVTPESREDEAEPQPLPPLASVVLDLLHTLGSESTVRAGMLERLAQLSEEHPHDCSPLIVRAYILLKGLPEGGPAPAEAQAVLEQLLAWTESHPLPEIPTGRRPNDRQRRSASQQVPLWLVARECLRRKPQAAVGETLAARAFAALQLQGGTDHHNLLLEWGNILAEQGAREEAERRWTQLLEQASQRPKRQAKGSDEVESRPPSNSRSALSRWPTIPVQQDDRERGVRGADDAEGTAADEPIAQESPRKLAPLTTAQFQTVLLVAKTAIAHDMPQLSFRAVATALEGGLPVNLPDENEMMTRTRGGLPRIGRLSSGRYSPYGRHNEVEDEDGSRAMVAVLSVIERWQGPIYRAEDVYALLLPLLLPPDRPQTIQLFGDSTVLEHGTLQSLGRATVIWAARAGKLDDLQARVSERTAESEPQVPALVLQTIIALSQQNIDVAHDRLVQLQALVSKAADPARLELACHAALPACEVAQLAEPAYGILGEWVDGHVAQGGEPGQLGIRLWRHRSDAARLKSTLENWLTARSARDSQHDNDYADRLRQIGLCRAATIAALCDAPPLALDYLGRSLDVSRDGQRWPYEARFSQPGDILMILMQWLATKTPRERYEIWRDWTFPTADRATCRFIAAVVTRHSIPQALGGTKPASQSTGRFDLVCNFEQLLAAAEEVGKLSEVRELAAAARDKQIEGAELLWWLASIRLGQAAEVEKEIKAWINPPRQPPMTPAQASSLSMRRRRQMEEGERSGAWDAYILYRACERSDALLRYWDNQPRFLMRPPQWESEAIVEHFAEYRAQAAAARFGAEFRPGETRLDHWQPVSWQSTSPSGSQACWVVSDEHLLQVSGTRQDALCLKYPLMGNFSFFADVTTNPSDWDMSGEWRRGGVGYSGALVSPEEIGSASALEAIPWDGMFPSVDRYVRFEARVADGHVKFFINGRLAYEEPVNATWPWLVLSGGNPRPVAIKNVRLSGNPTIPQEVPLIAGNRMEGWVTSFFGESQPRHRKGPRPTSEPVPFGSREDAEPETYDWQVREGVLRAEATLRQLANSQSWTYYSRPLQDAERVTYEFYYVPGENMVHPTLGRLAMLLAEDGVRAHWISQPGWDEAIYGIAPSNEVVETACRRGPATLPLKPHDWNTIELAIRGDELFLSLNGTDVYQRPLEPFLERQVGLFRWRHHAAQVRNVVLRGNWPKEVPASVRDHLLAGTPGEHPADIQWLRHMTQDYLQQDRCDELVEQSRKLPDAAAIALLETWVLPPPAGTWVRWYFERRPITDGSLDVDVARVLDRIDCPVIELIRRCEQAGQLGALADRVRGLAAADPRALHAQTALLALIAIQAQDDSQAEELIRQLYRISDAETEEKLKWEHRKAEWLVGAASLSRPALQFAALDLATRLRDAQRAAAVDRNLERQRNAARPAPRLEMDWDEDAARFADVLFAAASRVLRSPVSSPTEPLKTPSQAPHGTQLASGQWHVVPMDRVRRQQSDFWPATWQTKRGSAEHFPGDGRTLLCFQSPLAGKFEVVAECTMADEAGTGIRLGRFGTLPERLESNDPIALLRREPGVQPAGLNAMLPRNRFSQIRMVVGERRIATSVQGKPLQEERLTQSLTPWLMLESGGSSVHGSVRDLRVLGTPQIPAELDLLACEPTWTWSPDEYHEYISLDIRSDNRVWAFAAREVNIGAPDPTEDSEKLPRESLLRYMRPLLEDGEIEYESFYAPGSYEVHPAVGRQAWLIRPEGVHLHEIAAWRTPEGKLEVDNEQPIPGSATTVPLRKNEWNKFLIRWVGDHVTFFVNGQEVAQQKFVEPRSFRRFGLFRYGNHSGSRVRRILYRGAWPKELPAIVDQELAAAPDAFRLTQDSSLVAGGGPRELDLQQPLATLQTLGLATAGSAEQISRTALGTRLTSGASTEQPTALIWRRPSSGSSPTEPSATDSSATVAMGDIDVTIDVQQVQLRAGNTGGGAGVVLKIVFDAPGRWVEVGAVLNEEKQPLLSCALGHTRLDGENNLERRTFEESSVVGRWRLIRQGGMVHCLLAAAGSDEFRVLDSFAVGETPIREVRLETLAAEPTAQAECVATRMVVQ